ncbi:MAG: SNF2-related protein, partial [Polyangia bacterium]
MAEASKRSVLSVLTKGRLEDLAREFGVPLQSTATKDAQVAVLADSALDLGSVLGRLCRDELRLACRAHGVDATGRGRNDLMIRLGGPGGATGAREAGPAWQRLHRADGLPHEGQVVQVRQRQYLVTEVASPDLCEDRAGQTLVSLVCLDDDAAGRRLEVLWERELGARVVEPEAHGLGKADRLDPPRHFAAYLHALKWGCVTATDARLFQSPFRAGVKLYNHQLVPLRKALELPRVNLFLADDVGLGKTIEAGLILQELMLRQRVDQALIICPAALALQWRAEMERRFGIRFEIYNRDFVCRRREERGFGINPWTTFPRFIISYQTLRRPEYREPLLRHLDQRAPKSLLIMDEAHTAAPASASKYAVDSHVTNVVREVAPKFEHRLFLSATPHNGHSNSFSSLLEILDPQRFTRGVPVSGPKQLDPVMVRRLKGELRELGVEGYPLRRVIQIDLTHGAEGWQQRYATDGRAETAVVVGEGTSAEIELSVLLAQYASLLKQKNRRSRLVIANLQKRLLSSIEAFARTLAVHAKSVGARTDQAVAPASPPDDDEYGEDETTSDERSDSQMRAAQQRLADETEQRLAAGEQLRHADRLSTVGKLASGVAHE